MRNLALSDVKQSDLAAMLAGNETLFIEHKTAIGRPGFQVAKAVTAFANSLGGWVLIGVTNGKPNAGDRGGWDAVPPHALSDRVREVLAAHRVDPLPTFAATVIDFGDPPRPIGVVRVYESADAPHVMGTGHVFVRSIAEDRYSVKRWRPEGVDTQAALLALVARGQLGRRAAERKLALGVAELADFASGRSPRSQWEIMDARFTLRAVPLTGGRLVDWAVSQSGYDALEAAVRGTARVGDDVPVEATPRASGVAIEARTAYPVEPLAGRVVGGLDAGGVVVMSLVIYDRQPRPTTKYLTLQGIRDVFIHPLLKGVASLLASGELHGRSLLELRIGRVAGTIDIDDEGGRRNMPRQLPISGEVSMPADESELASLADQWRDDLGRDAGYLRLRQ